MREVAHRISVGGAHRLVEIVTNWCPSSMPSQPGYLLLGYAATVGRGQLFWVVAVAEEEAAGYQRLAAHLRKLTSIVSNFIAHKADSRCKSAICAHTSSAEARAAVS